jgi:hypothetical protein
MDESAKQQKRLDEELMARTKRLLDVSRRLYNIQKELLEAKTDLFG